MASSTGSSRAVAIATAGTTTKFAARISATVRTSRNGPTMRSTVKPSPMAVMLATTNASTPAWVTAVKTSLTSPKDLSLAPANSRSLAVPPETVARRTVCSRSSWAS